MVPGIDRIQSGILNQLLPRLRRQPLPGELRALKEKLPRSILLDCGRRGFLIKESMLPGVLEAFARILGVKTQLIEQVLRSENLVVSDTDPSVRGARQREYQRLVEEATEREIAAFKMRVMDEFTRALTQAGTARQEILEVAKAVLKKLGIGGVNIYLYDENSRDPYSLRCLSSEEMIGESRYRNQWGKPEGAKAYVLGRGKLFHYIADRSAAAAWGITEQTGEDWERFAQEEVKARAGAQIYGGLENVREEVYLRVKGTRGITYLLVGNSHLRNKEKGFRPLFDRVPGGLKTAEEICIAVSRRLREALVHAGVAGEKALFSRQMHLVTQLSGELDRMIGQEEPAKSLPVIVAEALPSIFPRLQRASILVGESPETLNLVASWGLHPYAEDNQPRLFSFDFAQWVLASERPFKCLTIDQDFSRLPRLPGGRRFRHKGDLIVLPFFGKGVVGVISIVSEAKRYLGNDDFTALQHIAYALAAKMEANALVSTLRNLAIYDSLTGFLTRGEGMTRLNSALVVAGQEGEPLSVLMLDLDHFKEVNDTYGHLIGDKVLVELTSRVRAMVGEEGFVVRYGGEEFVVVLPGFGLERAREKAAALCETVRRDPFDLNYGRTLARTTSIGVFSTAQDPGVTSAEEVVRRADEALYAAKEKGRDQLVIWGTKP